jgi:hypothetical protein
MVRPIIPAWHKGTRARFGGIFAAYKTARRLRIVNGPLGTNFRIRHSYSFSVGRF